MRFAIAAAAVLAVLGLGVLALASESREDPYPTRETEEPYATTVLDIVEVPPRYQRKPVRVSGTVVPVPGERFVLRDKGRAIVVVPEPGTVDEPLQRGDRVTITGIGNVLNRIQAAELRRLLRDGRHPALVAAPTGVGGIYISADYVVPAGQGSMSP